MKKTSGMAHFIKNLYGMTIYTDFSPLGPNYFMLWSNDGKLVTCLLLADDHFWPQK